MTLRSLPRPPFGDRSTLALVGGETSRGAAAPTIERRTRRGPFTRPLRVKMVLPALVEANAPGYRRIK